MARSKSKPKKPKQHKTAAKGGRKREIINRGPKKNVEVMNYPHLKGDEIHAEGQLEPKAIMLISSYPQVKALQEQAEEITFSDYLGEERAFPDFRITLHNGEVIFVEVKPYEIFNKKENRIRLKRIQQAIQIQFDARYVVLTDLAIELEPRYSNISLLTNYRYIPITPELLNRTQQAFLNTSCIPFNDFRNSVCDGRADHCYALIANGHLKVDLSLPLPKDWLIQPSFNAEDQIHIYDLIGTSKQQSTPSLLDPLSARIEHEGGPVK